MLGANMIPSVNYVIANNIKH